MKLFSDKFLSLRALLIIVLVTFIFTGCEEYPQYTYVENNPPKSDFTISVNNFEVAFTNGASHASSYLWDFGDGTTSTEKNVVHVYTQKGKYTVTLTATDANDLTAESSNVVPVGFPLASYTYEALKTKVTFTNTSGNASSYMWDFGDGETSTETNPVHNFPDQGTYTVKLTAINGSDENSTSQDIYVVAKYKPIILSPSFEGETSVYRVDWDWNGASGSGSPTPPDGTNGCKLGTDDWVAQTFVVEANTEYKIRYWYVTKAGATVGAQIKITDGTDENSIILDTQTGTSTSSSDYEEATIEFNSGNSTSIRLWLIYGDSETRLDFFSIE